LKAAAVGGAMGTLDPGQASMADEPTPSPSIVPSVTLGRTGQKVTILGMGTSWALSPSFVQAALYSGVRYIDTSEVYENTRAEKIIGEVLDRTRRRKDVYLVTKNTAYRKSMGTGVARCSSSGSAPAWSGSGPTMSTATTCTDWPATRLSCCATPA